ncbi:MAG: phosphoglycolate phosphatase [Rhodobacteraceae bacterium]|nr:MAG: phosphoglycolate phosphatase [Paracoccaceae bacterium]
MHDAVIFDLDGTLVDSAHDIHAIANVLMADLGAAPFLLDEARSYVGNGAATFVARCLAARGLPETLHAEALARFQALYETQEPLCRPYPGVEPLLAGLSAQGVPLGLCTNKPGRPAAKVLAALGWSDVFAVVVAGDTLPAMKPDPAPLRHALDALGGRAALYVGDSEVDAETAQAAGTPFALFTEGYRRGPVEAMAADFAFADYAALSARLGVG